jgi:prepilin-type N-terminal cleavage/methylation domain-containing protein
MRLPTVESVMTYKRAGFSLIELLVVIMIGSILVTIALSTFQNAQASLAARSAKTMYATLHQRARAKAIELGRTQLLIVDAVGDSAFIYDWNPQTFTVQFTDVTRFREQMNVDLRAAMSSFLICMTPRGYADTTCPAFGFSTTNVPIRLEFWLNADSTSVMILPMGQLVGM